VSANRSWAARAACSMSPASVVGVSRAMLRV